MDKIKLLKTRRSDLLNAGKEIRKNIADIVDEQSFVELSAYSFSKNDFYGEDAQGEGVVTGYATVDGNPVYVIAQNFAVLSGGLSNANCNKIVKCLNAAERSGSPVVYLLNSHGVQIGEGVDVLEGISSVLAKAVSLKRVVPQFAVCLGDVFGASALFAANADFTFFMKDACVVSGSPFVISAIGGQNLPKAQIGGYEAHVKSGVATFGVANLAEVRTKTAAILDLLPAYGAAVVDCADDMNRTTAALNKSVDADKVVSALFDKGTFMEMNAVSYPEIITGIGRVGGISTAVVAFRGDENGVELTAGNLRKIREFVDFVYGADLPIVNLVNVKGIKQSPCVENSAVLKELTEVVYSYSLIEAGKISVVYGAAIGMGYSIFAAKSMGYDYSVAFANAHVALFDKQTGAEVAFGCVKNEEKGKLAEKYADENADPIGAAKGGYIDDVIEPALVRPYVIASLQTLIG